MPNTTVISASQDTGDYSQYDSIVLAQGDSWFSIGAFPGATSNILFELSLTKNTCVINCARPGATLANMVDWIKEPAFTKRLSGRLATQWSGIFVSGGGNDLINAVQSLWTTENNADDQKQRLLLTPAERGGQSVADVTGYLSKPGWKTFSDHLTYHFADLVDRREQGPNQNVPIFCHTYDYLVPRDAAALPGFGPWLYKAMNDYQIPNAQWFELSRELINRLTRLLTDIIGLINTDYGRDMNLHLIDTRGRLIPADAGEKGASNDWVNEIHPTTGGYRKLAAAWQQIANPIL